MPRPAPLAIFAGALDGNSVAKICARLANQFVAEGVSTDLLVTATHNPVEEPLAPAVRVIDLGRMAAVTRVPRMAAYLWKSRPVAILTHRIREDVLTLRAVRIARTGTPVFVTVHGPMGVKLDHLRGRKRRKRWSEFRRYYPKNDGIIAISGETAEDLRYTLGADVRLATIPNPIVTQELQSLAREPSAHPWLDSRNSIPVVVFAGRLEREKDIPTLLHAFAQLSRTQNVRLIILGEGSLRSEMEALRDALGLDGCVDMPGWAANPYPYLSRANLIVLSSWWDALPTVLIEALALGTPVVSTDCSAGVREILDGGRLGELVAPRDPEALAAALARTIENPIPAEILEAGAARYEVGRNARLYLHFILGPDVVAQNHAD